jgi:hypothetical protein
MPDAAFPLPKLEDWQALDFAGSEKRRSKRFAHIFQFSRGRQ